MTEPSGAATPKRITVFVDADACPVKDEVYRVAGRYGLEVHVVANSPIAVPREPWIHRVVVSEGPDIADDWIAEQADPSTVVVTADILLADRALKAGSKVLAPNGKPFTSSSIGAAIATRAIMADLRAGGDQIGGPRPFSSADRSVFLQALDRELVALKRLTQS